MQQRIGHDFSDVRVHTDGTAAASARAVNAQAYTVGSNIVFDRGRYQPHTPTGTHLLAHELAHVAQQRGTRATAPEQLRIGDAGDAAERDADRVADGVTAGGAQAPALSAQAPTLARQPLNIPPNPYTEEASKKPVPPPAPAAEQSVGDVAYGSGGKFAADLVRREAIATNGKQPCALIATMRVKFVQADAAAWPAGRFAAWQQEAARVIGERWSMRYLLARAGSCAKSEPCQRSTVIVRMQPVTSGEHHTVNVRYNKAAGTRSDSSDWYNADLKRPREDMRKSQATANHEFGHLLGLDHIAANSQECKDARIADPKNPEPSICYGRGREERAGVMGAGDIVRPQDYAPFLAPMQTATACAWRVEGKSGTVFGSSGLLTGALLGGLLGLGAGAAIGAMLALIGVLVGGLVGGALGALFGGAVGAAVDE
ncbi:MAG: DUF4157 domain-containing protein [Dokdonella sp.]